MDSKNSPAPLGGEKTGNNPTDRGKRGAKMNLLVDQSGAPLSVVLTGANRHDKVSAVELIVSIMLKRPAHKEQHLCADQAYDASEVREFASSEGGYTTHIKVNPRKKRLNPIERPILTAKGLSWRASSGEEMGGGADDLLANQALQPPHSLVQEGGELVGIDPVGLCPRVAQLGGFRIESYSRSERSGMDEPIYRRGGNSVEIKSLSVFCVSKYTSGEGGITKAPDVAKSLSETYVLSLNRSERREMLRIALRRKETQV
jgi:transposase